MRASGGEKERGQVPQGSRFLLGPVGQEGKALSDQEFLEEMMELSFLMAKEFQAVATEEGQRPQTDQEIWDELVEVAEAWARERGLSPREWGPPPSL